MLLLENTYACYDGELSDSENHMYSVVTITGSYIPIVYPWLKFKPYTPFFRVLLNAVISFC